jgi:transposase
MRNIKLNNEMIAKASEFVSQGHYANVVCEYLGISEPTYYSYIKKAKEDQAEGRDSIFLKFFKSIKEAEAKAEMRHLQNILKTAQEGAWQASAWYLERKHKQRWSLKQEIQMQGEQIVKVRIADD